MSFKDFVKAAHQCILGRANRDTLLTSLQKMWTSLQNPNPVLPCLSVRTGLDLYLRVHNFPPGSEMIMSAINIPDMIYVVRDHGIKIVPMDVNLDTLAPKIELLESLITNRTVGLLLAHVYGRQFDMTPFIQMAQKHNLKVIEDCAESFTGFELIGHPQSDISLFSFGAIKYYTALGGAIAKIRSPQVYQKMCDLYITYPMQSHSEYLKRVVKYSGAYFLLNCPRFIKPGIYCTTNAGFDHQTYIVALLRGFPKQMMANIRHQPSTALLYMMHERLSNFDPVEFNLAKVKAEYISERLPDKATQIGTKAYIRNHWLFPVIVVCILTYIIYASQIIN